jgi:tetratricopeptide (TPR) repeat protein
VHSSRGEPTLAYWARVEAVQQARRPNEPITENPRQVTALRDVGVMAARGGAVERALTQFTDLLDAIPDLYAEGNRRNDSWIEEDIQYERRQLLLSRAHCHWMAGNLDLADTDLAAARAAHGRYTEARGGQQFWAIRPLPAFHVMLEARIAFDRGQYDPALEKSERLIPIYGAQVPIDGVPAIERLAGLHRLRARAFQALGRTEEANQALEASLDAAERAPLGNPGPDADRAEAALLHLCWRAKPEANALEAAFKTAREAIDAMIAFELPDGLLEGPHQSTFQARAVTLAIDCLKANPACDLRGQTNGLIEGMASVKLLEPLCGRLRRQLGDLTPTSESTTA